MNIVLYLASKYLRFKASDRGLSAIAVIAFFTIVVSSAAAVVILSVANGMHNNIMDRIMSRDAHIVLLGPGKGIPGYEDYVEKLKTIPGVVNVRPYFEKQALLKGSLNTWGSVVLGVPADTFAREPKLKNQIKLEDGTYDLSKPGSVMLGYNLAANLGVTIGSVIQVTVYSEEFMSLSYPFKVSGIFSAGHKEYDSSLTFISLSDAQKVFDASGYAYGIGVNVARPMEVEKYLAPVRAVCPYFPYTWKTLHRNELAAVQDEKVLIMIIMFFFFFVVAFNILSTMIAMVLDKKEEIGILKAMGLKPSNTLQVFLLDGFFLGALGGLVGIFLGVFIALTLNNLLRLLEMTIDFFNRTGYHIARLFERFPAPEPFKIFKADVYYLTQMPVEIQLGDLIFVLLLAVGLSTLAVIIPSITAARMRPVEVLRND